MLAMAMAPCTVCCERHMIMGHFVFVVFFVGLLILDLRLFIFSHRWAERPRKPASAPAHKTPPASLSRSAWVETGNPSSGHQSTPHWEHFCSLAGVWRHKPQRRLSRKPVWESGGAQRDSSGWEHCGTCSSVCSRRPL